MDPKGEGNQGRLGWETGINIHTNGHMHTVGQLMRATAEHRDYTALPFVSSDESSLFSLLLPAIDYQQRGELGETNFDILLFCYHSQYSTRVLLGPYCFPTSLNFEESLHQKEV